MIRLLFLMSVICAPGFAMATQNELQSILSARSPDELRILQSDTSITQRLSADCEAELKAKAIPRSCFQKIKRQLAATKNSKASLPLERERIDRICRDSASRSLSRLDLSGPTDDLTESCRSVIAKRLEDLRYTDEEAHPELSATRTLGPDLEN